MRDDSTKTVCRTPNASGTTRIPTWKFELMREAILAAVGDDGVAFKDLKPAVAKLITDDDAQTLGSIGWHMTTVKLEMECAGDIRRVEGRSPQYLVRA